MIRELPRALAALAALCLWAAALLLLAGCGVYTGRAAPAKPFRGGPMLGVVWGAPIADVQRTYTDLICGIDRCYGSLALGGVPVYVTVDAPPGVGVEALHLDFPAPAYPQVRAALEKTYGGAPNYETREEAVWLTPRVTARMTATGATITRGGGKR